MPHSSTAAVAPEASSTDVAGDAAAVPAVPAGNPAAAVPAGNPAAAAEGGRRGSRRGSFLEELKSLAAPLQQKKRRPSAWNLQEQEELRREEEEEARRQAMLPSSSDGLQSARETAEEDEVLLRWDAPQEQWESAFRKAFPPDRALFLFRSQNRVRRLCQRLLVWRITYFTFLLLTVSNFVTIAARDPVCETQHGPDCYRGQVLNAIELAFTACFTVELALQLVAKGAILHPRSHLRSGWGVIDALVVGLGWAAIAPQVGSFNSLRALRLFRAFRGFKRYLPTMRVLAKAIAAVGPVLFHLSLQLLFFFGLYAIGGIQLFEGLMDKRCVDGLTGGLEPAGWPGNEDYPAHLCSLERGIGRPCDASTYCAAGFRNPQWGYLGFDHLGLAALTVFQSVTLSQWTKYMYWTGHATNVGIAYLYFISMAIFGAFLILNMAIAAITTKYDEIDQATAKAARGNIGANILLFVQNRLWNRYRPWVVTREIAGDALGGLRRRLPGAAGLRRASGALLAQQGLRSAAYFAHFALLCAWREGQGPALDWAHWAAYLAFAVFFGFFTVGELLVRRSRFFSTPWNWIELAATAWTLAEVASGKDRPYGAALRLLLVLRPLARADPTLAVLEENTWRAVKSLLNFLPFYAVAVLLLSVTGMQLFGGSCVFRGACARFPGEPPRRETFDDLWSAYRTVFQVMSGDSWNDIMIDGLRAVGPAAVLYFVAIFLVGLYVLINVWQTIVIINICDNLPSGSAGAPGDKHNPVRGGDGHQSPERDSAEDELSVRPTSPEGGKPAPLNTARGAGGRPTREALLAARRGPPHGPQGERREPGGAGAPRQQRLHRARALGPGLPRPAPRERALLPTGGPASPAAAPPAILMGGILKTARSAPGTARTELAGAAASARAAEPGDKEKEEGAEAAPKPEEEQRSSGKDAKEAPRSAAAVPSLAIPRAKVAPAPEGMLAPPPPEAPGPGRGRGRGRRARGAGRARALGRRLSRALEPYTGPDSRACCCIPKSSGFRQRCARIVDSGWFFWLAMAAVCCNAAVMASEASNPEKVSPSTEAANGFFTVLFTLELALKVAAKGLVLGEGAYLRQPLSILDFVVVGTSLASTISDWLNLPSNKALRALRVCRSVMMLRLLTRLRTTRALIATFRNGGGVLLRVLLINAALWSVFGVVAVRLFGGAYHRCTNPAALRVEDCAGPYLDEATGAVMEARWEPLFYWQNLDSFPMAMLHLYESASLEQWNEYRHYAEDAVGPGFAVQARHNEAAALFSHLFLYFGLYVGFAMIIGTLVYFFSNARKADEEGAAEAQGGALLSSDERELRDILLVALKRRLRGKLDAPPEGPRRWIWDATRSAWFEAVVQLLVLANVAVLAATYYPRSQGYEETLERINTGFVVAFALEAVVKLYGLGPRVYLSSTWDALDGAVTFLGILGLAAEALNVGIGPNSLRALRLIRMSRLLRLARHIRGVRVLFATLYHSLPALCSVGLLILLIIYVYGIVGVWLFRHVMIEGAAELSDDVNFRTLPRAMVTLFRMTTGENWDYIMWDHMRDEASGCDPGVPFKECGSPVVAPVFFCSFMFLAFSIGNNLFIAVVLDAFDAVSAREGYRVSERDLDQFASGWERRDPGATGFMHVSSGMRLLLRTVGLIPSDQPARRPAPRSPRGALAGAGTAIAMLRALKDVPVAEGRVHYADLIRAVVCHVYAGHGVELPAHCAKQLDALALGRWVGLEEHRRRAAEQAKRLGAVPAGALVLHYAAGRLQAAIRGHAERLALARSAAAERIPALRRYRRMSEEIELRKLKRLARGGPALDPRKGAGGEHGWLLPALKAELALGLWAEGPLAQRDEAPPPRPRPPPPPPAASAFPAGEPPARRRGRARRSRASSAAPSPRAVEPGPAPAPAPLPPRGPRRASRAPRGLRRRRLPPPRPPRPPRPRRGARAARVAAGPPLDPALAPAPPQEPIRLYSVPVTVVTARPNRDPLDVALF
eukprot:tig00000405_g453.t1